jgi:hypothetical protein
MICNDLIDVLVYRCSEEPISMRIEGTLEAMQKIVGGYIEYVRLTDNMIAIVNETGLLDGLPYNRYQVFGDFFVAGSDEEGEPCSLTSLQKENVEKVLERHSDSIVQSFGDLRNDESVVCRMGYYDLDGNVHFMKILKNGNIIEE